MADDTHTTLNNGLQRHAAISPIESYTGSTDIAGETHNLHNGRQRLRPWLIGEINKGNIKGLVWMNPEKTMFKIPWKHAGKQDYDPEEDSKIFKLWSENTGKYKKGVNPEEPAVWKTRLRTALNKLPDIQEVTEKTMLDIPEPYRVYRLLPKTAKNGRDGARPNRVPGMRSYENNYYAGYDPHRTNGAMYQGGLPYQTSVSSAGWPQQTGIAPRQYPGQGYYPDDRITRAGYYEGYPHGMPLRDAEPMNTDEARNIVTSQAMHTGHPYMHGNNNDPTQADQYGHNYPLSGGGFPNPEYYPTFVGSPAPTDGYYPGGHYPDGQMNPLMQQGAGYTGESDAIMKEISATDCLPGEHEFEVNVFYRSTKVICERINSTNGCHIYYNKSTNNHLGSEEILLPAEPNDRHAPLRKSILDASEGGLTLQVKNRVIYVTRFCRSALFCGSSLRPTNIQRVERFIETPVFDMNEFSERVKSYLCHQSESPPSPAVYFSVAQNWSIDSPLKNCLISIVIRPLRSVEQLRTMNKQAKSLPLSLHSGLLHFSGPTSIGRENFEDYQDLLTDYPFDGFDPVAMAEDVFIQSEGESPSP